MEPVATLFVSWNLNNGTSFHRELVRRFVPLV